MFGSASGLTSVGNQFWTQQSPGVPGNSDAGDNFGDAVLAAEVTGDTLDDVVIGVPRRDLSGVVEPAPYTSCRAAARDRR